MVVATYSLLVDWNNDGDFADTGEDVTSRCLSLEWIRGRDYASQLLGRSNGGILRAVLRNDSNDYNSFNSASPLFGNLLPGRKVRLNIGSGSFPYTFPIVFNDKPHFVGFLNRIEPSRDVSGKKTAVLEAVGSLAYVNQKDLQLVMSTSLLTNVAVGNILDEAGWPAADRDLATGQTTLTRFWLDRQKTLSGLRIIEETEAGFIYEAKDGKIVFKDRHHRLKSPHTVSQATISDDAADAVHYRQIRQEDPLPFLFNEFRARYVRYAVGALAVLWTLPDTGADSPTIAPAESKIFWASYPNPDSVTEAFAVDAWTTPVITTDYTANSASDGTGTNLTSDIGVVVSKFANNMKIALTNNHASLTAFITLLQARGTPVNRDDPVLRIAEDAASQTAYGERTFTSPSEFFPTLEEAQDWAQFHLGIYKDPIPLLAVEVILNNKHDHLVEALVRDIGDRITLKATGNAGLGINEDFFIEAEQHKISPGGLHKITWLLSPATGYSDFFILNTSTLDSGAKLAY